LLGHTYAGDSIVAILAGHLSFWAATYFKSPTGPFILSAGFLLAAVISIISLWKENTAIPSKGPLDATPNKQSISEAVRVVLKDKKILSLGLTQAFFEGAMYIFVLQWPPVLKTVLSKSKNYRGHSVPFGKIFSCFMAICLLGSTLFNTLTNSLKIPTELYFSVMLGLASAAMFIASRLGQQFVGIAIASFFFFEVCVGMYFPAIGTLRSKYLPDSYRSVIMTLFGIPLNLIVVSVFLSIKALGVSGALSVASAALMISTMSMSTLFYLSKQQGQSATATAPADRPLE
jgi:hypothetical protein